ncbi:unnamed protein product [Adineta steineri]|uniref:Uncharacterized protein n=1 Tax=Adineta steineri TaxID=433720 RepID=A0A813X4U8_9BILA|nr:unnamed protein product [Adineta steineri]
MGSVVNKQRTDDSLELTNLVKTIRTKSILENQDDFEECVLIWLDSSIKYNAHWADELNHAREIINNLKIFDQLNDCINFMKMIVYDKIFLIVSHQYIQSICAIKSELRHLTSIYVYCDESLSSIKRTSLETWARDNEPLITGVYSNSTDCFAQLSKDVYDICDHDSIPVTYLSPQIKNQNLKQSSSFLIFHFFLQNILSNLLSPINKEQRHRIFRSCLYYYRDNDKRIEEIKHFEQHYNSQSSIDLYLRTKFFSRLLHKASQTANFALLFDYSFILNDIQNIIQEKSITLTNIYYRAQNLNADDLYRLRTNLNGIISINTFLGLCKTAEAAVNEVSLISNTLETVLYHFSINQSYISISDNKVLLSIGSLFRIEHIGMEMDGVWHVHLKMLTKDDINDQIEIIMKEIDFLPHKYLSIGLIWDKIKQSGKADRFYRLLIEHLSKTNRETALICNYIGTIIRLKCQYPTALTYHKQALTIYKEGNQLNSSLNEDIDRTYAQIALVYRDMGDTIHAIEYFKLISKQGEEEILNQLGEIYRNLEKFHIAHQYYQQTKSYNNIGLCYINQRMFPEALSYLKKEPNSVSNINLGVYHQLRKEYSTALIFFEKALETIKDRPLDIAMIHSYLGLLHCDSRQWLLSLKHYEQALALYKRHLINNHPTIALIHDGLGTLYLTKGEFRAAQREYERCLELQLRVLPANHPDVAGTYNNLGGVFNELGQYEQALLYHLEALAIATATLPNEHSDIKLYQHNIIETKRKLSQS